MLEKAVRAAKGKVKLVKMNIDDHPAIPGQMGIQSIPAVIAFVGGQPADGFMGAVPESQVNAFIDKLTKGVTAPGEPNIAEILGEAEAVLAEGDPAAAAQIYAEAWAKKLDVQVTHVSYRGIAPALVDVLGNRVGIIFSTATSIKSHVEAGSLQHHHRRDMRRAAGPGRPEAQFALVGLHVGDEVGERLAGKGFIHCVLELR